MTEMILSLEGKRALVGGSSKGIGLGCAISLAEAGAAVVVIGRDADTLEEARLHLPRPLEQIHGKIIVDFSDWRSVRDAAVEDIKERGAVQILVNNTGGPPPGLLTEAAADPLSEAFTMHVLVNQALANAVLPGMIDARYGRIINIISSSVLMPIPNLGVSNTIRGAVAQWGKTLAGEVAAHGVTVNNLLPGSIDTARLEATTHRLAERTETTPAAVRERMLAAIPAGRLGTPADIGNVVAFLASPAAAYINGVNLPVDGGRLATQ